MSHKQGGGTETVLSLLTPQQRSFYSVTERNLKVEAAKLVGFYSFPPQMMVLPEVCSSGTFVTRLSELFTSERLALAKREGGGGGGSLL